VPLSEIINCSPGLIWRNLRNLSTSSGCVNFLNSDFGSGLVPEMFAMLDNSIIIKCVVFEAGGDVLAFFLDLASSAGFGEV